MMSARLTAVVMSVSCTSRKVSELLGQFFEVRLDRQYRADAPRRDPARDFHGGAFAQIVDIRLVRQPEQADHRLAETLGELDDPVSDEMRLAVVDLARRLDQRRLLRRRVVNEPRDRPECNGRRRRDRARECSRADAGSRS